MCFKYLGKPSWSLRAVYRGDKKVLSMSEGQFKDSVDLGRLSALCALVPEKGSRDCVQNDLYQIVRWMDSVTGVQVDYEPMVNPGDQFNRLKGYDMDKDVPGPELKTMLLKNASHTDLGYFVAPSSHSDESF